MTNCLQTAVLIPCHKKRLIMKTMEAINVRSPKKTPIQV